MPRPVGTLVLTLALVGFMMASAYDAVAAGQNPCKADYKRLCGNVKPGQGRLQACLKQHKDEISPECKAFLETKKEEIQSKMEQAMEQVPESCKADYKRLCGNVKPGQGRLQACLKQHKDEVSPECKAFLETKKEEFNAKMEKMAEACKADAETLCPGVKPGEGRILKCLLQHKDGLSAECRNALHK